MKKKLICFLFLTIFSFGNAQEINQKVPLSRDSKANFGVKGGYSLSNMKFYNDKLDSKSYFYVGLIAELHLSKNVSIQAELLYSEIGGYKAFPFMITTEDGYDPLLSNSSEIIKFNYKFSQIQIPISVKYYLAPKFSVLTGMNFGINTSSKVKTLFNGENINNDFTGLSVINFYPFFGGEYKIYKGLFLDARYNFNFVKMNQGNADFVKIGFLQAGVGYRFN